MKVAKPQKENWNYLKRTYPLYLMLLIPIVYYIIFKYIPMYGTIIAFKDYNIFAEGMFGGEWVGLKHFKDAFAAKEFWIALKNTLVLNLGDLLIGFPIPILLAIGLNEVRNDKVRKFTQMVTYLPHFLSWVIIAGISFQVFSNTGLVNTLLENLGFEKMNVLSSKGSWRALYWGSGVWQAAGYSLIIYLAALMGLDPTLEEAASIDGASRLQRIRAITIPMIAPTISVMLVMQLGKLMNISFDRPYLMGNALVSDACNVISTHVYQVGIGGGRFDYAAAVGLFQSVVGIIMILTANKMSKKIGEGGIM